MHARERNEQRNDRCHELTRNVANETRSVPSGILGIHGDTEVARHGMVVRILIQVGVIVTAGRENEMKAMFEQGVTVIAWLVDRIRLFLHRPVGERNTKHWRPPKRYRR